MVLQENFQPQCPSGDSVTMGISVNNSQQWINTKQLVGAYDQYVFTINEVLIPDQFMVITADQKNGTVLTIAVSLTSGTTTDAITNMWLASEDHSDCTYCGTLQNNSTYHTTWIGSNGNYLWSTPTLVSLSTSVKEHFQSQCVPCPPPQCNSILLIIILVVVTLILMTVFFILFRKR